jgi:hypothetical protein
MLPFLLIFIIVLGISLFVLFRNKKVYTFRLKLIDMCGNYNMRHIDDYKINTDTDAFTWLYRKLPSYNKMLFSFKSLKIESYITEEHYEKLIN